MKREKIRSTNVELIKELVSFWNNNLYHSAPDSYYNIKTNKYPAPNKSSQRYKRFKKLYTKCMICGNKRKTCVDHCHRTGKIRGVLCRLCNTGLGMFRDDIDFLKRGIVYLERRGK